MTDVSGMGPDAPTVYNDKGAAQSKLNYRFDLIDGPALFEMASVLHDGAEKYGDDNWRGISVRDHLNHLIAHAYAYLSGDTSDQHLSHIMCRAMFAQAVAKQDQQNQVPSPTPRFQTNVDEFTDNHADIARMEEIRQQTSFLDLGDYGHKMNPRYLAQYNNVEYELTRVGWEMVRRMDSTKGQ